LRRPPDRCRSCRGRSQSRWSARSAARTYDLDCDLCAALGCPAREDRPVSSCRCGHRRCVAAGTARVRVRGLIALRQRPAPVRCRARGGGPGCRPPAESAPSTPAPAAALPLVHTPLLSDPRRCSEPGRGGPSGAPAGRALEAVEKVVTARASAPVVRFLPFRPRSPTATLHCIV
jgi:hypothetical protein